MKAKRVYGIDLGTTYSCIAHVDEHGKPVVLANAEGEQTTPSVVFFESPTNIVVGQAAKEVAAVFTDRCVSTVKRAMGDPQWECVQFDQVYKPQDVSSFILRKVVGDAEGLVGEKIEDVVITCPAYFGLNEKEATRQAGILAGLNVLYVIPEPTAAALAYGMEQEGEQTVLVYDLGGGTFDVTVIAVRKNEITVICTGGDHQLGGKNWDDAIVAYLAERFEAETGTAADAVTADQETYQELLNAAERCKKSLSTRESVVEAVRFGGERARVELTRETFDQITASLLERTLELTQQVLDKARAKGQGQIDRLLLVGGSTYMPQVIESVKKRFQFDVRQYDPNQAVAKGAAIFGFKCQLDEQIRIEIADVMGQRPEEIQPEAVPDEVRQKATEKVARAHGYTLGGVVELLKKEITNVSSKSFGVVVMNHEDREVVANLVKVDDQVPKAITQQFGTYAEGQIQVDIVCMESVRAEDEIEKADCIKELGKAALSFGKPLPQGSPIEIAFDLGPDGLLTVHGRDLTTGNEIQAGFKTESIMSREELEASTARNRQIKVA
jgi:molecular chaperone DnaK